MPETSEFFGLTDPAEILTESAARLDANPSILYPLTKGIETVGAVDANGDKIFPTNPSAVQWDVLGLPAVVSYGQSPGSEIGVSTRTCLEGVAHPGGVQRHPAQQRGYRENPR